MQTSSLSEIKPHYPLNHKKYETNPHSFNIHDPAMHFRMPGKRSIQVF